MLDTIKTYHHTIDTARQSARNAARQEAEAQRYIDALVPALTDEERQTYDAWLTERERKAGESNPEKSQP